MTEDTDRPKIDPPDEPADGRWLILPLLAMTAGGTALVAWPVTSTLWRVAGVTVFVLGVLAAATVGRKA